MKRPASIPFLLALCLSLLVGCAAPKSAGVHPLSTQPLAWDLCFSPKGGCTDLVVNTLAQAKSTVLVQAYSFTSEPIAQALAEAHRRGVKVEVILDKSQTAANGSQVNFVAQAGVPVRIDSKHAIAHNKIMVIDGETVITGSFNFTKAAEEHNAENLVVLRDKALAARYDANWQQHKAHSEPYNVVPGPL